MKTPWHMEHMTRRAAVQALAIAGAAAVLPRLSMGRTPSAPLWRSGVIRYLQTLARPDGGYAWRGQGQSHLTPTFAVIGCHQVLRQPVPNKEMVAEFVRTRPPSRLKKLEQPHHAFEYQQIQSLIWLGPNQCRRCDIILVRLAHVSRRGSIPERLPSNRL